MPLTRTMLDLDTTENRIWISSTPCSSQRVSQFRSSRQDQPRPELVSIPYSTQLMLRTASSMETVSTLSPKFTLAEIFLNLILVVFGQCGGSPRPDVLSTSYSYNEGDLTALYEQSQ